MQCPYCVTQIDDAALVCPQCRRDLYLYKPLLEKIATLEARLTEQPDVAALQARVQALEAGGTAVAVSPAMAPADTANPPLSLKQLITFWVLPLGLLLLAHLLMTVVYDINTLYLRIASILIPLPFGLILMRSGRHSFGGWCVASFVLACAAVLGMSAVIGYVDGTPVLPANPREWREFLEYAASICFSFITGMVLASLFSSSAVPQQSGWLTSLVSLFMKGKDKAERLQKLAQKLHDIGGSIAAAGTTAVSIYTGLKDFLGGNN